jgi:thymidylate kinase
VTRARERRAGGSRAAGSRAAAGELDFPAGTLELVRTVFTALNDGGVRYCHWKSTTGLPLALAGGTDLDLLVDRAHAAPFTAVVRGAGFKPFISHPSRRFVGVEDWLGHDPGSGRLVHLHVYYRLVLGEDHVKNHVLPIEDAVLDGALIRHGVKVPAPAAELAILIVRALLKYRRTDAAKDALRLGRRGGLPPSLRGEAADLARRVATEELAATAGRLLPSVAPEVFTEFLQVLESDPRDAGALLRLRGAVRRGLRQFERLPRGAATAMSLAARLERAPGLRRILRPRSKADLRRKSSATGGLTVAIVGADGAGKSTVIDEVVRWLGWRLNLRVAYLGTARPSPPTAAAQALSRVGRRIANRWQRSHAPGGGPVQRVSDLFTATRYLAEARERADRAREGRRLAANGTLVLFDRFPLDWVRLQARPVDGPRIAELGTAAERGLLAALRRREEAIYAGIGPPDLVILLAVEPDVALARKPSARPGTIEDKARAVLEAARQATGGGVVVVDASRPLDEVVRAVEDEIWRRL